MCFAILVLKMFLLFITSHGFHSPTLFTQNFVQFSPYFSYTYLLFLFSICSNALNFESLALQLAVYLMFMLFSYLMRFSLFIESNLKIMHFFSAIPHFQYVYYLTFNFGPAHLEFLLYFDRLYSFSY